MASSNSSVFPSFETFVMYASVASLSGAPYLVSSALKSTFHRLCPPSSSTSMVLSSLVWIVYDGTIILLFFPKTLPLYASAISDKALSHSIMLSPCILNFIFCLKKPKGKNLIVGFYVIPCLAFILFHFSERSPFILSNSLLSNFIQAHDKVV